MSRDPQTTENLKKLKHFLVMARDSLVDEFGLSTMESHDQGFAVEKEVREVWDYLHEAIGIVVSMEKIDAEV